MNWLQSNSRPRPLIDLHVDLDEGRHAQGFCCTDCRGEGCAEFAFLSIASPAQAFVVSLDCGECGRQLVEFDQFNQRVMRLDGKEWRAA